MRTPSTTAQDSKNGNVGTLAEGRSFRMRQLSNEEIS